MFANTAFEFCLVKGGMLIFFSMNGFRDTLVPRQECTDTDVKISLRSTKLFQILQL